MEKDYYCVLVSPKKYKEMLEEINSMRCVYPPKKHGKNKYAEEVKTLYSLPVEISQEIDEDLKYVTKEEYEEIKRLSIKKFEQFMKEYVSDEMFKAGW